MARASTPTLLALDRYAQIMGVDPAHFNGGASTSLYPMKQNTCEDIWPQHPWQFQNHVSREDVAWAIHSAEEDIARAVGYYPAPTWICQEVHRYSRYHRRDLFRQGGRNNRYARASVVTNYGKFIQGGQRGTTQLTNSPATTAAGTLDYDFDELTATIEIATTLTDECEIHVYFAGNSAAPEWEIRPANSVAISGGTLTMVFDSWKFIDPALWEAHPTAADFGAIDITSSGNHVTSVEIWRIYNDFSQYGAQFYWDPAPRSLTMSFCASCNGTGCPACSPTTQYGCVHARDNEAGVVVPVPGTYDSDDEVWDQDAFDECRDPDEVKLWYYAGEYDNRWLCGDVCDPMSNFWAQTIAWMATARLDREPCQCGTIQKFFSHLRTDLALVSERSQQVDLAMLANPFGTRRGEVMAWQRVSKLTTRRVMGGAI